MKIIKDREEGEEKKSGGRGERRAGGDEGRRGGILEQMGWGGSQGRARAIERK